MRASTGRRETALTSRHRVPAVVAAVGVAAISAVVELPRGTFKIDHASAPTAQHDALNPTTCVDLYTQSGKFTVGHGTGAYTGVTGTGTYSVAATSHFKRVNGKCDENVVPIFSYEVILATATVE